MAISMTFVVHFKSQLAIQSNSLPFWSKYIGHLGEALQIRTCYEKK